MGDLNSPLTKRTKTSRTNFNDVRGQLKKVIKLRKNAGDIIDEVYSAESTELLKYLSRIEVDLSNTDPYTIPDVDDVLQGFKGLSKQHDKTVKKCYNHIVLLAMLEQKRNCPIAKIIDEI